MLQRNYLPLLIRFRLSQIKRHLMRAMMMNNTPINRSFSKPVGVCSGRLKFVKKRPISSRLKDTGVRNLSWVITCLKVSLRFLYDLLSVVFKLFAFTNLIPSFTNYLTSHGGYDVQQQRNQWVVFQSDLKVIAC